MELNEQQHPLYEELLALRRETWETNIPVAMNDELFSSGWSSFDGFNENQAAIFPNMSFDGLSMPCEQDFNINPFNEEVEHYYLGDEFSAFQTNVNSSNITSLDIPCFPFQEDFPLLSMMKEDEALAGLLADDGMQSMQMQVTCKMEQNQSPELPTLSANCGTCSEPRTRPKKLNGQPSKNLMAERRRRKRLNDRLSMLRSIVPKISKMDRTSILGDTIDYVKELLEKISNLQQQIEEVGSNQSSTVSLINDAKRNILHVRNSPKFSVENRNEDTRIEISCSGRPGLLLSTVNTLEALGLEIEQCVISCFNEFSMQASCSEVVEQRTLKRPEEIKQALFENAGYAGRCL